MATLGTWRDGWHTVPQQVVFRDIDAFGHVNNAVFFTYFEWGRTAYWLDLTGAKEVTDVGFIVARAECDFRSQIALETLEIATRIGDIRNTSMDFECEIRKHSGEVAGRGKVVVVMFDWVTKQKTPITDEFRERVRTFQTGG
jgi:acyl-CoA thioester hydrolase